MEKSLENRLFWVCIAARYSSMFDEIYWTFIDDAYYGTLTSIDDRLKHLDQEDQTKLAAVYQIKTEQAKAGNIDPNYSLDDAIEL